MSRILTTEEVLELLPVSKSTLMRLANQGLIPARKVGGKWLFREDLLLAHLAGGDTKTQSETGTLATADA